MAIAPELSTTAAGTQTAILAIVDRQIDEDAWLDLADDGRRYLSAHLGSLAGGVGGAGPVTMETLGPMSRSYGLVTGADPLLGTTKYGLFYLHLIRLLPSSIGFVP